MIINLTNLFMNARHKDKDAVPIKHNGQYIYAINFKKGVKNDIK